MSKFSLLSVPINKVNDCVFLLAVLSLLFLSLWFFILSFKGIDDDHCFDTEATMLTSKNIQNLKCLYNYKCFVSGGERMFFMGLGVSISLNLQAYY